MIQLKKEMNHKTLEHFMMTKTKMTLLRNLLNPTMALG